MQKGMELVTLETFGFLSSKFLILPLQIADSGLGICEVESKLESMWLGISKIMMA